MFLDFPDYDILLKNGQVIKMLYGLGKVWFRSSDPMTDGLFGAWVTFNGDFALVGAPCESVTGDCTVNFFDLWLQDGT